MRLRKSIKIGPARVNLSKSGVGYSIGAGGVRVGRNAKGKSYTSVRTPLGTSVRTGGSRKGRTGGAGKQPAQATPLVPQTKKPPSPWPWIAFGALAMFGALPLGLVLWAVGGYRFYQSRNDPKTIAATLAWEVDQRLRAKPPEYAHRKLADAVDLDPQLRLDGIRHLVLAHSRGVIAADRPEAALRVLDRYVELDPDIEVQAQTARLLDHAGEHARAVELFKSALSGAWAESQRSALTPPYAQALVRVGRPDEAVALLQGLEVGDDDAVPRLNALAEAMEAAGRIESAVEVLLDAPLRKRNLDEDLKRTHYTLGRLYSDLGNRRKAVQHLRRVYAVDAQYEDVSARLSHFEEK